MAKALFLEDLPIIGKYVRDLLANKVDKVEGKSLSTNDYTTEEKTKLETLSSDYDDLTDKPSINGVTLTGNKTTEDLIPIGDGLGFNTDGELEATGGSDVLVIEAVKYNETSELYNIKFGKSLTEIVSDIEGVNGNAIVKIWTTSSKVKCYLSETFNNDGSGNWVTNIRRYSNNFDIVCRDVLMIGNSSDNRKSVWKYPLQKNLTFDSTPTQNSSNPVTSGGIYNALQNAGGTTDYTDLENQPQINGVTLSGNKTSADLGLMDHYDIDERPTEDSENLIPSGAVWSADKNIKDKLQGSKTAGSTDGSPFEIPDYGMTESIAMHFKPTQDLHGYDKPWAGGAGKNKLPLVLADIKALNTTGTWSGNTYSINNGSITIHSDAVGNVTGITANGTFNEQVSFAIANTGNPSAAYLENIYKGMILNGNALGGSDTTYCLLVSYSNDGISWANEAYGDMVISSDYDYLNFAILIRSGVTISNATFYPMIRLSTEPDADFEPYSNICPISGQNNATFEWTGKNKWDEEWELGIYNVDTGEKTPNNNYIRSTNAIPVSGSTQYYFYSDNVPARILFYDSNGGFLSTLLGLKANTTITTPANCAYVRFFMDNSYGTEYDNDIAFNYPATVTTYSRYIHDEVSMNFGNTYYGGFCQFNGQIYPEWDYIASYNGETLSGEWVSDRDEYTAGTTPTIGAEVAYKTTPSYVRVTPPANLNLTYDYPIEYNGYMASIYYQPKNTVLAEAKKYTDQKVSPVNTKVNGLDTRVQILENGGDRSLNYSTTEQVVGTWIDGKPLYQITKQWQVPAQVTGQWNNYSVGNLGQLGYMNISELAFDCPISNYRFGNTVGLGTMEVASSFEKVGARLGYNTESGNVFVQLENVGTTSPLYQYGGTLTATIRYTKATD